MFLSPALLQQHLLILSAWHENFRVFYRVLTVSSMLAWFSNIELFPHLLPVAVGCVLKTSHIHSFLHQNPMPLCTSNCSLHNVDAITESSTRPVHSSPGFNVTGFSITAPSTHSICLYSSSLKSTIDFDFFSHGFHTTVHNRITIFYRCMSIILTLETSL